jgi:hypothetical protein
VRRLWTVLLLGAAVMVPASPAVAAPTPQAKTSPGGIGVRAVTVAPGPSSNPLARLYIIDRLAPGTNLSRGVEVSNSTRDVADVAVYVAGASVDRAGFKFSPGRDKDELSSWTSVSRDVLRLQPRTDALETITLRVPKDASSGEKYAVVWAQVSAASSAHRGLLLVNRVGIRMYVSIGRGGTPAPDFTLDGLGAKRSSTGEPVISVTVHNSGEEPIDISGHLALSDGPGGLHGGPYPVALAPALVQGRSEVAIAVLSKALPDGPWKATISLTSGVTTRSASATLTFPAVSDGTQEGPSP